MKTSTKGCTVSIYDPQPCGTKHESWECRSGWHECNDCRRGLGTRENKLEEHKADQCELCGDVPKIQLDSSNLVGRVNFPADVTSVSGYITKDSGQREEYASGMRRDTQEGKPRFDLLFVDDLPMQEQLLTRWAQLMERGATKYGEKNWQLANSQEELARFRASAARHFFQWMMGEVDEDHAAAVCYNLSSYIYLDWKLKNADDGPVQGT